jgi:hypothetical protein
VTDLFILVTDLFILVTDLFILVTDPFKTRETSAELEISGNPFTSGNLVTMGNSVTKEKWSSIWRCINDEYVISCRDESKNEEIKKDQKF